MELFDVIRLKVDRPGEGLKAGMVGTIVEVYVADEAFLVEFADDEGRGIAFPTLRREEMEMVIEHRPES